MDSENIFDKRKQQSKKNRANPMDCVCDYFYGYYYENSFDEFIGFFKKHVTLNTWVADDFLFCMEKVINNVPADLIDRLYDAGVFFYHNDTNETDWEYDEYHNWLKKMHELLKAIEKNPKFVSYLFFQSKG